MLTCSHLISSGGSLHSISTTMTLLLYLSELLRSLVNRLVSVRLSGVHLSSKRLFFRKMARRVMVGSLSSVFVYHFLLGLSWSWLDARCLHCMSFGCEDVSWNISWRRSLGRYRLGPGICFDCLELLWCLSRCAMISGNVGMHCVHKSLLLCKYIRPSTSSNASIFSINCFLS